jgi:kynureninase
MMHERNPTIDVERARADTPGCEHVLHLNNAGSSLPPKQVLRAVIGHVELEGRIGGYEAHEQNERAVERFYGAAAELLGARPDEIAFCSSATRAWDMAFYAFAFERRDRILTSVADYISNYIAYIQVAERTGAEIVTVPNDECGQVSVDALRDLVDEHVKLVAITHVPTNSGLVNPVAEIGAVTRATGIPYLVDACQSAGQLPLDVDAIGCDALSATGRKFLRGPRGTGFLYVRRRDRPRPGQHPLRHRDLRRRRGLGGAGRRSASGSTSPLRQRARPSSTRSNGTSRTSSVRPFTTSTRTRSSSARSNAFAAWPGARESAVTRPRTEGRQRGAAQPRPRRSRT